MDTEILSKLVEHGPVVLVLGGALMKVWSEYQKEKEYSRAQEKLTITTLIEMANSLNKISDSDEKLAEEVSEIKQLLDLRSSEILTLQKNK